VARDFEADDGEPDSERDKNLRDDIPDGLDADADDDDDALPDRELARLVHALERVVTISRRTIAVRYAAYGVALPVPATPGRAELIVLTALVQTYGLAVFRDDFSAVRQRIAQCGVVMVLQQAVLADRPTRGMPPDGSGLLGGG
jgi:hypothetical protein